MQCGLNRNNKEIFLDEPAKKFLASLKSLRKSAGKTRYEIANNIGATYRSIWDWETGRIYPRLEKLIRLAEFFNYDISNSINYKYFYKTLRPDVIQLSMRRYGLTCKELEELTGFKRNRVRASIMLRDDGTIACLAAVLAIIEQERKFYNFRRRIK